MGNNPLTGTVVTTSTGITHPADTWNIFRNADIDNRLAELNIKSPVFYKVLELASDGSDTTVNPRYEWGEDDIPANKSLADGAFLVGATTITVDDGSIFKAGDVIRNMTDSNHELIYVSSVSGNDLTVTRGYAGSTAQAGSDDAILMILHFTLPEAGDAPDPTASVPDEVYNYISQFARTFEVSELHENTDVKFNIAQVNRETMIKAFEIRRDISNQFMYGNRLKTTISSKNVYETGGVHYFLNNASYQWTGTAASAITWALLNTNLLPAYEDTASSDVKAFLCGYDVMRTINKISDDKLTYQKFSSVLGGVVTKVVLDSGQEMDVMLDKYTFGSGINMNKEAVLLDLPQLGMKWMQGMQLKWKQNIQNNDAHVRKDEVYGACGLVLKLPELHRRCIFS